MFAGGTNPRTPLGRVILGAFMVCFGVALIILVWTRPVSGLGMAHHPVLACLGFTSFFVAWCALVLWFIRADVAVLRHRFASTGERATFTHRFDNDLEVPFHARLLGSDPGRLVIRFEAAEHDLVAWNLDVEVRDANGIVVVSESAEISTADRTPNIERVIPGESVWPLIARAAVRVETSRDQIAEPRASCAIELFALDARIEPVGSTG